MSGKGIKPSPKRIATKHKEISKPSTFNADSPEAACALSFPLLKTVDNARTLPRYSVILNRPDEEGVAMEDIDGLQLELEALLSAVVVRTRVLQDEIRILSDEEEKRDKTREQQHAIKRSHPAGRTSVKRSKIDDCTGNKSKLVASPIKFTKVKTVSLVSNPLNQHPNSLEPDLFELRPESWKDISPINDTLNKFWSSVEPYCAQITHDDVKLLQDLIDKQESAQCFKIPQLGKHYTCRWDQLADEEETDTQLGKAQNIGPLTQRLVSALLEENFAVVHEKKPEALDRIAPKPPAVLSTVSINLERRLRRELEIQGIVDLPGNLPEEDDEILDDIKRCQNEIKMIANNNLQQLRQVLKSAMQEMKKQELAAKLEVVDRGICDLYRKIQANKLKKKTPIKKEQDQAWKALKDRELLLQEIDSL